MRLTLSDLSVLTLAEGGEFASMILTEPKKELEESTLVEIVWSGLPLFEGTVSYEAQNEVGFQIVQAVATSVSSSGEERYRESRMLTQIDSMLNSLDKYGRKWLVDQLKGKLCE